jgi:acetyl esterase/lipase
MRKPVDIFLMLTFAMLCIASIPARAQDARYTQLENVVYGEAHGVGLLMDVFTPSGKVNGLAIVDVISGAWHSDRGKIRDHARAQTFQILCAKGYTVFAVRPGSTPKFTVPEMVANLNEGIRWVKDHAAEYKIDPDAIGLMGASAGGHLACLVAVTATERAAAEESSTRHSTRVKAVAVFFPLTDFLDFNGQAADARADDDLGKLVQRLAFPLGTRDLSDAQVAQQVTQISPARLVTPDAPPFLLIHGDADPVVPLQQSERMVAALKEKNVSAELIVKRGGGHPWLTIHEEVRILADWFDKQLQAN